MGGAVDRLCLRVGDEKEADEADTVGATTLRPEHVTLLPGGRAEFKFLGKDSVPWHKELALPPLVYETMEELIRTARPSSSAQAPFQSATSGACSRSGCTGADAISSA